MLSPDLNATQLGTVGEQLVRYKLLRWGYQALTVEQGNDYDIVVITGVKPIRLQVKSTKAPAKDKLSTYKFSTSKGSYNNKPYAEESIDGYVFVALDTERVLFHGFFPQQCKRINCGRFTKEAELSSWTALLDNLLKQ